MMFWGGEPHLEDRGLVNLTQGLELAMTEVIATLPLRQRMIEDMVARLLKPGTQRGYIRGCKRFAAFLKRFPETATAVDVRLFQFHLAETDVSICIWSAALIFG
jgi:Phage integrase, N-terminal SAM-like domain